jgi:hypothetical protein
MSGRRSEADEALRELEAKYPMECAYQIAAVRAARGDADGALAWLGRAVDERDAGAAQMAGEPVFRPLHGDPRWDALLERIGLRG